MNSPAMLGFAMLPPHRLSWSMHYIYKQNPQIEKIGGSAGLSVAAGGAAGAEASGAVCADTVSGIENATETAEASNSLRIAIPFS